MYLLNLVNSTVLVFVLLNVSDVQKGTLMFMLLNMCGKDESMADKSPTTYSYKTGTRTAEKLGFSLHAK
jgi:hypothetical protein